MGPVVTTLHTLASVGVSFNHPWLGNQDPNICFWFYVWPKKCLNTSDWICAGHQVFIQNR